MLTLAFDENQDTVNDGFTLEALISLGTKETIAMWQ